MTSKHRPGHVWNEVMGVWVDIRTDAKKQQDEEARKAPPLQIAQPKLQRPFFGRFLHSTARAESEARGEKVSPLVQPSDESDLAIDWTTVSAGKTRELSDTAKRAMEEESRHRKRKNLYSLSHSTLAWPIVSFIRLIFFAIVTLPFLTLVALWTGSKVIGIGMLPPVFVGWLNEIFGQVFINFLPSFTTSSVVLFFQKNFPIIGFGMVVILFWNKIIEGIDWLKIPQRTKNWCLTGGLFALATVLWSSKM